jgi:asparagine synthase (glutamine-hydrolysing)
MPGLTGLYSKSLSPYLMKSAVKEMNDLLCHRSFFKEDQIFHKEGFAASRVHIDVYNRAPQPASDQSIHVWLDGEFHNKQYLMERSGSHCNSDAEILHHLYRKDPEMNFLQEIDGGYAAVIYDEEQKLLHMITDRYCRQHLYFTRFEDGIAWASEIKAFSKLPSLKTEIDPEAVEEFIETGNLIGNRTWFKNVSLIRPSTVKSINLNDISITSRRYWWWDRLTPLPESTGFLEMAEEAGRLLKQAVKTQTELEGKGLGIALSGGKDSRAILAAIPETGKNIHAVTFGKQMSWDIVNSSRAAKIKGVNHHIYEMNSENWFDERLKSIWWSDGLVNLINLNANVGINDAGSLFDNAFVGLGGIALNSGNYLLEAKNGYDYLETDYLRTSTSERTLQKLRSFIDDSNSSVSFHFKYRFRNFGTIGLKRSEGSGIRARAPLLDNHLIEFIHEVPHKFKRFGKLYKEMLVGNFPDIFADFAHEASKTDVSAKTKCLNFKLRGVRRAKNIVAKSGLTQPVTNQLTDYQNWIRIEPAAGFIQHLLLNSEALYSEFIGKKVVIEYLRRHSDGENFAEMILRFVTLEIWLQQILNGKYRNESEYQAYIDERNGYS